jgi:hypothetical protein
MTWEELADAASHGSQSSNIGSLVWYVSILGIGTLGSDIDKEERVIVTKDLRGVVEGNIEVIDIKSKGTDDEWDRVKGTEKVIGVGAVIVEWVIARVGIGTDKAVVGASTDTEGGRETGIGEIFAVEVSSNLDWIVCQFCLVRVKAYSSSTLNWRVW